MLTADRQQREEILRKQEKLEVMLKRKKGEAGGVRPESPGARGRRRVVKRPSMPARRLATARNEVSTSGSPPAAFVDANVCVVLSENLPNQLQMSSLYISILDFSTAKNVSVLLDLSCLSKCTGSVTQISDL